MGQTEGGDTAALTRVRRLLLAVLWLGTAGMLVELLLITHYEDFLQWAPLAAMTLTLAALSWHWISPTTAATKAVQSAMALLIVAGAIGIALHYRGAMEFQLEVDRSLSGRSLFWKAIRAKAPPALAPGALMGIGLIGFAYVLTTRRTR